MSQPNPPTNPGLGILWMLGAGASFVVMTALVKSLGDTLHPAQTAFLRYALGLVFVIPAIRPLLSAGLSVGQWSFFAGRGAVHTVSVLLWFFAMTQISLAEVTAMNYLTPVYVTLGAALFLGEKLAFRRMAAIAVALMGVVVILRPGLRGVEMGHLAMLGTSLTLGASYLMVKIAVGRVAPVVVLAQLSIWVTLGLAPFAWVVWQPVSWPDLGVLALIAVFANGGHYFMTRAMQVAPVVVTQPVTFLQLVWATLIGVFVFGEPVDPWVITGGSLILGAVSFISWREMMLNRKAITPPDVAVKL